MAYLPFFKVTAVTLKKGRMGKLQMQVLKRYSKPIFYFLTLTCSLGLIAFGCLLIRHIVKDEDHDILEGFIGSYERSLEGYKNAPESPDWQSNFAINSVLVGNYRDAKTAFDNYDKLMLTHEKSVKQTDHYYIFLVAYAKAKMHQNIDRNDQACNYWRIAKKEAENCKKVDCDALILDDYMHETYFNADKCK